jgi:hypothetical protein
MFFSVKIKEYTMKVKLRINYTDGEEIEKDFESLEDCLNYIRQALIEKDDYADNIYIEMT